MFKKLKKDWELLKKVDSNVSENATFTISLPLCVSVVSAIASAHLGAPLLACMAVAGAFAAIPIPFAAFFHSKIKKLYSEQSQKNAAGQTVKGPKWALELLKQQQEKIMKLSHVFNGQTITAEQKQKLGALIEEAKPLQKEVTVISAGTKGAGSAAYEFVMEQDEITVRKTTKIFAEAEDLSRQDQKLPRLPIKFIESPGR